MKNHFQRRGGVSLLGRVATCAVLALGVAACETDAILDVYDPSFASPVSLDSPDGLPTLVAGAYRDFQVSYSGGGGDSFLSVTSVFSDEYFASGTFTTRIATDQRDQFPTAQGNTSDGSYNGLHRARRSARDAADAVKRLSTNPADPRFSALKSLEGYTYLALGEGFCSGIPFSETEKGAPRDFGDPLSTQQVFEAASAIFDQALAGGTSNLARVGKGRALLNIGRASEAAQAVASVPTTFVHFVEHSANSGGQYNPLFALQSNGRYSIADREGTNGLPFRSAADPRVPFTQNPAGGFDRSFPLFLSLRAPAFSTHVPIATGVEARLIEAEALLLANNAGWLAKLNELRASPATLMAGMFPHLTGIAALPPLTDPGSPAARLDLVYSERAFWLFNTGTRMGDMRRLVRVHNRNQNTVFPVGNFRGGPSVFGNHVTFPIPFNEVNNPKFTVAGCDVTKA